MLLALFQPLGLGNARARAPDRPGLSALAPDRSLKGPMQYRTPG